MQLSENTYHHNLSAGGKGVAVLSPGIRNGQHRPEAVLILNHLRVYEGPTAVRQIVQTEILPLPILFIHKNRLRQVHIVLTARCFKYFPGGKFSVILHRERNQGP